MNKKKIIILTIMFVAIVGLTLAPANAATKTYNTGKLYFKEKTLGGEYDKRFSSFPTKKIDSKAKNILEGFYSYPKTESQGAPNTVVISLGLMDSSPDYKMTKVFINFKKKVNGKTVYSTKTFTNSQVKSNWLSYKPKNNYQPNYCIIYYQKIKK